MPQALGGAARLRRAAAGPGLGVSRRMIRGSVWNFAQRVFEVCENPHTETPPYFSRTHPLYVTCCK